MERAADSLRPRRSGGLGLLAASLNPWELVGRPLPWELRGDCDGGRLDVELAAKSLPSVSHLFVKGVVGAGSDGVVAGVAAAFAPRRDLDDGAVELVDVAVGVGGVPATHGLVDPVVGVGDGLMGQVLTTSVDGVGEGSGPMSRGPQAGFCAVAGEVVVDLLSALGEFAAVTVDVGELLGFGEAGPFGGEVVEMSLESVTVVAHLREAVVAGPRARPRRVGTDALRGATVDALMLVGRELGARPLERCGGCSTRRCRATLTCGVTGVWMAGKLELYKDAGGKFRFLLKASNGEIIAISEAYNLSGCAQAGIESLKANARAAPVDDQPEDLGRPDRAFARSTRLRRARAGSPFAGVGRGGAESVSQ